jgi:hypothetical protein
MSVDDGFIPGNTREEKQNNLKEWYLLNLNHYYKDIEKCTFKTIFIPLTPLIAKVWQKKNRGTQVLQEESNAWEQEIIVPLEKAIAMFPSGAFVKLSTRSPKDAVDKNMDRVKRHLSLTGNESKNDIYFNLRQAFFHTLRVKSAQETLDLMSSSARIISDLLRALEHQEIWDLEIVVREFVEFDIKNEFRGFYYNEKLTCLSQYDTNYYHPIDKDAISKRIHLFMETFPVKTNCIIDFAITDTDIYIIELNPFTSSSGCALFKWNQDLEVLQNGPFEFRVLTEPRSDTYLTTVMSPWKPILVACTLDTSNHKCNLQ